MYMHQVNQVNAILWLQNENSYIKYENCLIFAGTSKCTTFQLKNGIPFEIGLKILRYLHFKH